MKGLSRYPVLDLTPRSSTKIDNIDQSQVLSDLALIVNASAPVQGPQGIAYTATVQNGNLTVVASDDRGAERYFTFAPHEVVFETVPGEVVTAVAA